MIRNISGHTLVWTLLPVKNVAGLLFRKARGSGHRNHCPNCLYSVHLDNKPGDRSSECHGRMEPISVWVRKNGEWAIIHRCKICGKISSNRIAADDNPMKLMALAMRPFGSTIISQSNIKNMTISMES